MIMLIHLSGLPNPLSGGCFRNPFVSLWLAAKPYRLHRIWIGKSAHSRNNPVRCRSSFNPMTYASFEPPYSWRLPVTSKFLTIFACILACLSAIHAQSNYAVVRGSILDLQHRAVVGAHVRITASETGAVREVVSNSDGLYEI